MIARIWRGWTRHEDTETYAKYVLATGIAGLESTPGNQGAYVMSRRDGDRTDRANQDVFEAHEAGMDTKVRYSYTDEASIGFENIKFKGAKLFWDEHVPDPAEGPRPAS